MRRCPVDALSSFVQAEKAPRKRRKTKAVGKAKTAASSAAQVEAPRPTPTATLRRALKPKACSVPPMPKSRPRPESAPRDPESLPVALYDFARVELEKRKRRLERDQAGPEMQLCTGL